MEEAQLALNALAPLRAHLSVRADVSRKTRAALDAVDAATSALQSLCLLLGVRDSSGSTQAVRPGSARLSDHGPRV